MALAPAFAVPPTPVSANDPGPLRPAAPRPAEVPIGSGRAILDAPALMRLLQFLVDAETANAVLHRATVSLGLLTEIAWAELDGDETADIFSTFPGAEGASHRIDVALADPGDPRARAAVAGMLALVEQVYRRIVEIERLRAEATTDPLTGLWNRRGFEPLLEQALARAARTGEAIAVVLIDVDRFKQINDDFGHGAGDGALVAVAAALHGGIRPTDVAARLGGDEFAVLLSGADAQGARLVCERVRRALVRANPLTKRSVTLSFGIADLVSIGRPTAGRSALAAWLAAADGALYDAKAAGRDNIVCHGEPQVIEDDMTQPICVRAS